jgi:hypothetical protein
VKRELTAEALSLERNIRDSKMRIKRVLEEQCQVLSKEALKSLQLIIIYWVFKIEEMTFNSQIVH